MHALRRMTLAHGQDNGGTDEPAIIRNFTKTRAPVVEIPAHVREERYRQRSLLWTIP
jgi:hypothetical protein